MKEAVEILNRDTAPYSEKFGDDIITIPAGGKVVMPRRDAVRFLGSHAGFDNVKGKDRVKNLEIVAIKGESDPLPEIKFTCPKDGLEFPTKEDLEDHIKKVHPGEQFLDARLEKKVEGNRPIEDGIKCPLCDFVAKNKAGLRVHLANCKGGE